MRLKSPFKDYYDGLQSMDLEPEPLYLRKTSETHTKSHCLSSSYGGTLGLQQAVIGFAGRLFPVVKHVDGTWEDGVQTRTVTLFYSFDEVVAWATPRMKKRELENALKKWGVLHSTGDVARFFADEGDVFGRSRVWKSATKHFDTFNVPIFILEPSSGYRDSGDKITLNPRLQSWNFARIMPPYEAWRDLSMYWGGKAQPNNPIPEVSDKDMLIAKGFDKWSFKTPPSKQK